MPKTSQSKKLLSGVDLEEIAGGIPRGGLTKEEQDAKFK